MRCGKRFEKDLMGDTSSHDRSTALWLASAVRAAASSRVALVGSALVIVAAFAAWTVTALWALPILFMIVLAAKLLDGRARQSALRLARVMPMRLPEPTDFSDLAVRDVVQRLAQARRAIGQVLDTGPRGPGFDLASAVARVPQLERDVVVLAQRAEYVASFLADHPVSDLAAEARRHDERIEREQDPAQATFLQRAGAHLKSRLETATTLKQEYETLLAAAKDGLGALEAFPARMMVLQLRRLEACHLPSTLDGAAPADLDASMSEIEQALAADRQSNELLDLSSKPSVADA